MTSVAVLMGGPDAEREVSIASGTAVAQALQDAGFSVLALCIDQPGRDALAAVETDVFFPVLHGPWGEGGPLQSLLEACDRPFVGSGSAAAVTCMNKSATKEVARDLGIDTPDWSEAVSLPCPISPPVVVKPVDDGSSVSLFLCETMSQADQAIESLVERRGVALVERWIRGRELTVAVVEGVALDLVEIRPADGAYDYAAKYERDDTVYQVDPDVPQCIAHAMGRAAERITAHIGVRDLARVDFILDGDTPWLLEINTMPGFTSHSLLPMAAQARGWNLPTLCGKLVKAATARFEATGDLRPRC